MFSSFLKTRAKFNRTSSLSIWNQPFQYALSNDGIKNILGNLSNIESYHIISLTEKATSFIEKKLSANLNTSLNALQKIKNFNFTEAKNNFNISLCNIKKK